MHRSGRATRLLALLVAGAGACQAPDELADGEAGQVGAARSAIGEPTDGFPSWAERVGLVWANRARCDPAADLASCTVCAEKACYSPVQPLVWSHNLGRAARFHSDNLALGGCSIQHDSPCTLVADIGTSYTPGPCNGAPSCACEGGSATCRSSGTAWNTRIGRFGTAPSGENIASSGEPVFTFYLWLHEPDTSSACGFRMANGHRYNILNGGNRSVGIGRASSGGGPTTQDFGSSGTPSGLVSGVHYPQTGSPIEFRANWYGATAAPTRWVNLDGTCHDMTLERGTTANGTYLASVTGITGCQTYYFHFSDGTTEHYYPTTGSYGIGCSFDWTAERQPPCAGCEPDCNGIECGDDGCGGSCGTCTGGKTCNASGQCVCPSGLLDCSGSCVDSSTDPANCGSCGTRCVSSEVCTGGRCVCAPSCAGRECGDDGCGGSCGSCSGGSSCDAAGRCVCPAGTADCGGTCADLSTDRAHCGECGRACEVGEGCVDGGCTSSCEPSCAGRECGDDGCGGSCGPCGPGLECDAGGRCVCPDGLTDCGGACVETATDREHCGRCDNACGPSETCVAGVCRACSPSCEGRECGDDGCGGSCGSCGTHRDCDETGRCVCWDGLEDCGGECIAVSSDPDNCGGCGARCGPFDVCYLGFCLCVPLCEGRMCGGDGCGGSCGSCGEGRVCVGARCLCEGGTVACGEDCVDPRTDPEHCGRCDRACADGQVCVNELCVAPGGSCEPDCEGRECGGDGCEGSCGVCEADRACADRGRCFCHDGLTACEGACVDLRADDAHCGACGRSCPEESRCIRGDCSGATTPARELAGGPFEPASSLPGVEGGWDWGCECRAARGGTRGAPVGSLLVALGVLVLRRRRGLGRDPVPRTRR